MKSIRMIAMFLSLIVLTTGISAVAISAEQEKLYIAKVSEDGVQRIEIKLDNYSFDPNHIVVTVNKPVELTLKNVAGIVSHNLAIDHPEAGMSVNQDVKAGGEAKVTFTPTKTGTFEFYCNKTGIFGSHKKKGMVGTLEVKE